LFKEAFLKLLVHSDLSLTKTRVENSAELFTRREGCFAVMPTGFGKSFIFQLFSTAIEQKKISKGKHPNSVILVICPLISLIEDQIKEGQPLGN